MSAGVSDPSTTRMLAERTTTAVMGRLRAGGQEVTASFVDLAGMASDIGRSLVSADPMATVQRAIELVGTADGLIVATPVYKAGISGLFKWFADLLDDDLIVAKPVVLSARPEPLVTRWWWTNTSGHCSRSCVMPVPTSLFAAPEDWADPALRKRIDRAAVEFTELVTARVGQAIADAAWQGYQHQFAGNATRAEKSADDLDFDTHLMRLAAGGSPLANTQP
ncbi:NAD(P)H-dependent oxidoreductase [Streptomyces olivaceoviridis]|uniref:NAD(P)H-dependent oxidoreductase n=1 Tax=Streptomyces olivaceoviridis TaxID=1921 RepID=UPI0036D0B2FA